jgi:phage/plasmid-associated DNA primase
MSSTKELIQIAAAYKACFKASGVDLQIMPLAGDAKNPKYSHKGGIYNDENIIYNPCTWIDRDGCYCNFGWLLNDQVFCIDLDGFGEDDVKKKASAEDYYKFFNDTFPLDMERALIEKTRKGYHLIWKRPAAMVGVSDHTDAFKNKGMRGIDLKTCTNSVFNGHVTRSVLSVFPSKGKSWIDGHNPLTGSLIQECTADLAAWIIKMLEKPVKERPAGKKRVANEADVEELKVLLPKMPPESYEKVSQGGDWDLWQKAGRGIINIAGVTAGYDLFVQHCKRASCWTDEMEQQNLRYWRQWCEEAGDTDSAVGIGSFRFWTKTKAPTCDDSILFLLDRVCNNPRDHDLMAQLGAKVLSLECIYNDLNGCWCAWSGTIWKENCEVARIMSSLAAKMRPILDDKIKDIASAEVTDDYTKKMKQSDIKKLQDIQASFTNAPTKAVIERMSVYLTKSVQFDNDPYLFGLQDCVLDLKSNQFREYRFDDYIATRSNLCKADVERVKETDIDGLSGIINQILPHDDIREHVLYLDALSLNGFRRDLLVCHNGSGANGKTILKNLRAKALGEYACATGSNLITRRIEEKGPQPEIMKLKGKRCLTIAEPSKGDRICADSLKLVLGGDSITARGLYERRATTFVINSGIDLLCNDRLDLDAQDGGVSRRVLDIYYDSKFVDEPEPGQFKKDRTFETDEWLGQKAPVYFRMLMDMHFKYLQLNMVQYQKPLPEAIKERTKLWLMESNPFISFINEMVEPCGCNVLNPKDGHEHFVSMLDLHDLFTKTTDYNSLTKMEKRKLCRKHCKEQLLNSPFKTAIVFRDHPLVENRGQKHENMLVGYMLIGHVEEPRDCELNFCPN